MPTQLWVAVLLPFGAALAFLSLEFVGIPLVVVALGLIFVVGRKTGNRAALLMSLGAGYVTSVSFFAIVTSGIFRGVAGLFAEVWFASHFSFGVALIVLGWIMQSRRVDSDNI